ncbi:MAG: FAD-dependent thymidylate synthase [Aquificae bacterium]|nr:FAD-dependent thymidylate synthase [Aquificota bacterium]
MEIHLMGSDQRVVRCARVSFARDDTVDELRDKRLIRYLFKHRHASPFEHVIVAFRSSREEWLRLLSLSPSPAVQAYYSGGYLFLNLRNAVNLWEHLPQEVKERLREALPTTTTVILKGGEITDGELEELSYSRDGAFVRERRETSSGWIGLVDRLELGTEMDYYTFVVECPLFVARQWFRHRFGSFNEVSKRYVGSEYLEFYIPRAIRRQAKSNKQASLEDPIKRSGEFIKRIEELVKKATDLYEEILREEGAKELARGVLPQFMKTRFYWTVPRVSLDNFITLRTHEGAQKEIREFALLIKEMVGYRETDRKLRL